MAKKNQHKHITKLPNAPLQEVIFEALWDMGFDANGNPTDSQFELAQGVFAKSVKSKFPYRKRPIPVDNRIRTFPKTIHQFWKGENEWPVIQIGPGILTVHDTEKKYVWENSFRETIEFAIKNLRSSYEEDANFFQFGLRYINAVEIPKEQQEQGILNFINENFRINLSNNFELTEPLSNININQVFALEDGSSLNLAISNGISKSGIPSVIWQIHIFTESKDINIFEWLDSAHKVTSNIFKKIITDEFYNIFK